MRKGFKAYILVCAAACPRFLFFLWYNIVMKSSPRPRRLRKNVFITLASQTSIGNIDVIISNPLTTQTGFIISECEYIACVAFGFELFIFHTSRRQERSAASLKLTNMFWSSLFCVPLTHLASLMPCCIR